MFDNSHRNATQKSYVSLRPGGYIIFHVHQAYPLSMVPAERAPKGKPYETSPLDVFVYEYTPTNKDTNKPGPAIRPDDMLRWEPAAGKLGPLINLHDSAIARHNGDKAALRLYVLRCDVIEQFNGKTGNTFHIYDFRALDANGNKLDPGVLPPAPTVTEGEHNQQTAPAHQQPYQGQQSAQHQQQYAPAPAAAPAYTPLDELRESLAVVTDFPQLQQAWAAVAMRLAAAGLVPQAQQLTTPVKRRLLMAEIQRHTDGQMLTQAKADIVRRCGADGTLAAEISAACDRRIAETTDTGFAFGANVGGGVDDIPL
jgi:hypothetical protein